MSTRGVSLDEYTGFQSVDRFCSSNVCSINYEEHTPEHWSHAANAASLGGGNPPAPSSSAPPPPPPRSNAARARRESGTASRPLVTGPAPGSRGAAVARGLRSATATQRFIIDPAAAAAALQPSMGEDPEVEDIAQLILPPAPPHFPSVRRGDALLPERVNDPSYYPGLVNDPEPFPEMRRKWPGWANYAVGGAAIFIAGLIARGVMSGPATWSAVVDVTPADAHVTIDGETLSGASSPRTREGLIAGDHVLVAEQSGYVSQREVFSMSETDRRVVISLDREKKPEPVPDVQPTEPTPVAQPEAAAPAAASSVLSLLHTSEDGKALSKKELARLQRKERVAERFRERKEAAAERRSKRTGNAEAASSAPVVEHAAKKAERAEKKSSGSVGLLKLNSIPWSQVYIDKKLVGNTPLLGLQVAAGKHTVELKNPDTGARKKLKIKVNAGETLTKIEKLGS